MRNSEIYKKIVENLGEGVWLIDDKNNTILVNSKMEEMLGFSQGEMSGRSVFDFMDLKGAETTRIKLIRGRNGIKEKHEFVLLHKKGHKIWTMMATCPLSKEDGAYAGAIAIVSDLTDKKRKEVLLEAQRNIFKILANNGTLKEALTELITGLEILIDGAQASIMVLDNEEKKIKNIGMKINIKLVSRKAKVVY
jgi:PAS domain S-box-containing protein